MEYVQFHKAYWNEEANLGIGKIHFEPLGVLAFLFDNGCPIVNVNFLNEQEVAYYRKKSRKFGVPLQIGVQIDRDVELIQVILNEDFFDFPELNLRIDSEENKWQSLDDRDWNPILAPFVEYQPCNSLICIF